jgi:two-component sensor histidine kinase
MSVLSAIAGRHTRLSSTEVDHLHRLLGEWQLLADLAFADLLLLAPVAGADSFVILGQVRPYPAQTLYPEDLVGRVVEGSARPQVAAAAREHRVVREGDPEWREGTPIREEAIPVMFQGRAIAVVSAEQNLAAARTPSRLELSYMRAAHNLEQMIAEGTFPFIVEEEGERELTPRVGDGFLELDAAWRVTYASPNAVSAFRRLGVTANIIDEPVTATGIDHAHVVDVLAAGLPLEDEVEANGAWVVRRFIPVIHGGERRGAIGLIRDITESRVRDRMISIKDATIREIHHRVKNNLQTVASLLRLQARRLGTSEARAELEESVRRISSIALVHEMLSQQATERVEFDRVAQRLLAMVEDSLVRPDRPVRFSLVGSAGDLPSDVATPLSLVLTELLQNAVEHAFADRGGAVTVGLKRSDPGLLITVRDDGNGLPEGFSLTGGANLGLQIVRTLVTEMSGRIEFAAAPDAGTTFEIEIPLPARAP